jgi:diguanylate cyclase (GGDEF)-like protein
MVTDRPIRGVTSGGVIEEVGAACEAVADHLAADGGLQAGVWLEREGRLRRVAAAAPSDARALDAGAAATPETEPPTAVRATFETGGEHVVGHPGAPAAGARPGADEDTVPAGFRARACLPIVVDGVVRGVLDILFGRSPGAADLAALRAAAADLSRHIAAADAAAPESSAMRMLRHVAGLSALQEPDAIARAALDAALDVTGLESAALLRRTTGGHLETLASIGMPAAALRTGAPDALDALAAGAGSGARVIGVPRPAEPQPDAPASPPAEDTTPEARALAATGTDVLVAAGLVADGHDTGLMLVAGDLPAAPWHDLLPPLEALAATAANCVRAADHVAVMRERAATDPLTGLGHHATFHQSLAAAHRRPSTAVAVCDVDGFKRVNDSFGHQKGDEVLKAVAAALGSALRRGDTLFRIGGDEFAALLAVAGPAEALEAGHRLRAAVEAAGLGVTVSVGVAVPREDEPDGAVVARADRALYRVKETGRDGVALAADEPLPIAPAL